MRSLVLVDAVGIKVGDHLTRDIADTFVMKPRDFLEAAVARPRGGRRRDEARRPQELTDDEALVVMRNKEVGGALRLEPVHAQPEARRAPGAHPRAVAGAVGRIGPRRHAGLRPGVRRAHTGRRVQDDRVGRALPVPRAAGRVRGSGDLSSCSGTKGGLMRAYHFTEMPYPFVPPEVEKELRHVAHRHPQRVLRPGRRRRPLQPLPRRVHVRRRPRASTSCSTSTTRR